MPGRGHVTEIENGKGEWTTTIPTHRDLAVTITIPDEEAKSTLSHEIASGAVRRGHGVTTVSKTNGIRERGLGTETWTEIETAMTESGPGMCPARAVFKTGWEVADTLL
jgi:hypothetical protein